MTKEEYSFNKHEIFLIRISSDFSPLTTQCIQLIVSADLIMYDATCDVQEIYASNSLKIRLESPITKGNIKKQLKSHLINNHPPQNVLIFIRSIDQINLIKEVIRSEKVPCNFFDILHNNSLMKKKSQNPEKKENILFTGLHVKRYMELGSVFHQPMIKIEKPLNYIDIDTTISEINNYTCLVFTSSNAVIYFLDRVKKTSKLHLLRDKKIISIGKHTSEAIKKYGLQVNMEPEEDSSEGIVRIFDKKKLIGERILFPRSNLARTYLIEKLRVMGNLVNPITVYRNIYPTNIKKLNLEYFDKIIFASPSGVRNFVKTYGELPSNKELITKGWETQKSLDYYKTRSS